MPEQDSVDDEHDRAVRGDAAGLERKGRESVRVGWRRIQRFLSQPFFVAEAFTGSKGKYVKLEDTVKGFKMIVDGQLDEVPEQAFYMKGGIDEVLEAAETMKAEA